MLYSRIDILLYMQMWASVTPLTFTRVASGLADIDIIFAYGDHGDGIPFKNDSNAPVAHTFDVINGGDIHFNEATNWTTSSTGTAKSNWFRLLTSIIKYNNYIHAL